MPRQLSLLGHRRALRHRPAGLPEVGSPLLDEADRIVRGHQLEPWDRLTVGRFIDLTEHQFGSAADEAIQLLAGYRSSDRLTEADIRMLCDRLGLPAADFGVDP